MGLARNEFRRIQMQYILLLHVEEAGWPKLTKAEQ